MNVFPFSFFPKMTQDSFGNADKVKADFPQIYVQRYNLVEGKKSIEPVNFG